MKKTLAVVAVALLGFSGCSMRTSSMSNINPNLSNSKIKYEIVGKAEGTASCVSILSIFEVGDASGCAFPIINTLFGNSYGAIEEVAMTRAIDSIPNADSMLAPRFTMSGFTFPLLFSKKTVTVRGKAVEFK